MPPGSRQYCLVQECHDQEIVTYDKYFGLDRKQADSLLFLCFDFRFWILDCCNSHTLTMRRRLRFRQSKIQNPKSKILPSF
jgi:hypothetical protein